MRKVLGLVLILVVLTLIMACAPKATPTPSPSTAAPTAAATKAAPTQSADDAAWAKILDAAKKEGKVTAYSYNWTGDAGLMVKKAFESKYGIELEITTGTQAVFTEKLKTEKRLHQMVGDFTEGSSLLTSNMKVEGLLTSVANELPALREKGVFRAVPWEPTDPKDKMVLVWRLIDFTPYVNTKLVKPADIPTSWRDFLDPKWKGQMTFTEPNLSSGPYEYMVVLMDNGVWDMNYLKALFAQDLRFPVGVPDETRMLAAGESLLMIRGADSDVSRFAAEGAPIKSIDIKEGLVLTTGSAAVVADSPHPNAVKVFMNWLFTQEGQTVAGKAQSIKMLRNDVQDFRPANVQTTMTKPYVESLDNLTKATQMFRDKWIDTVVTRKAAK